MRIRRTQQEAAVVLALEGRLDAETDRALLHAVHEEAVAGARCVILDCAGLEFLSSAGLRAFLTAANRFRREGGRLAVAALQGPARLAYDISRFDTLIATYGSVEEAVGGVG